MAYDPEYGTNMELSFEFADNKSIPKFFQKPIAVLAWSFGSYNGMDEETKKFSVGHSDLSLTKFVTAHSPILINLLSKNTNIPFVTLKCENQNQTIHVKLGDAVLSSISTGGSGGETQLTENITFMFKKVEITYEDGIDKEIGVQSSTVLENDLTNSEKRRRY
jgi:type VI secretion system secreted protein Hcp